MLKLNVVPQQKKSRRSLKQKTKVLVPLVSSVKKNQLSSFIQTHTRTVRSAILIQDQFITQVRFLILIQLRMLHEAIITTHTQVDLMLLTLHAEITTILVQADATEEDVLHFKMI